MTLGNSNQESRSIHSSRMLTGIKVYDKLAASSFEGIVIFRERGFLSLIQLTLNNFELTDNDIKYR